MNDKEVNQVAQNGDVSPAHSDEDVNHSLVITENDKKFNSINLFNPTELAAAENFITKIMRSDKSGLKSVNDGLAILLRAKDLCLPFSSCIEHIHVINGKTGLDIHLIKALLSKAACIWRCTKDYQALYEYTDGINVYKESDLPDYVVKVKSRKEADDKTKALADGDDTVYAYPVKWYQDTQGNIYRDYQLNSTKFGVASNPQQIAEFAKQGKIGVWRIPNRPVDYITEYEITRMVNGKEMKSIGHFSYSEAEQADMFSKDTYKKYPRILIGHRAFTYAARDIASDVIAGCYETTELYGMNNKDIPDAEYTEI